MCQSERKQGNGWLPREERCVYLSIRKCDCRSEEQTAGAALPSAPEILPLQYAPVVPQFYHPLRFVFDMGARSLKSDCRLVK